MAVMQEIIKKGNRSKFSFLFEKQKEP